MIKHINKYLITLFIVTMIVGTVSAQDDAVVVQLNWIHDSAWAGFYAAVDEGLYSEAGMDVSLEVVFDEEGNFIDVVDEVVSGRAQFGILDTGALLSAREAGEPIVAIATIYQRNPLVLTSLEEKGIVSPEDLIGKTAHISGNSIYMFQALLSEYGIDPEEVNIVERTDYSLAPLLDGDADVIDAWVTNELSSMIVQDIPYNAIYPFEYGIDMYPNVIVASQDLIDENPGLVQDFLVATLDGIQAVVDDTEYAADLVIQWDENLDYDEQLEALFRSVPLFTPSGNPPGMMLPDVWEIGFEVLVFNELVDPDLDLEAAYTMEFLDAIYGG